MASVAARDGSAGTAPLAPSLMDIPPRTSSHGVAFPNSNEPPPPLAVSSLAPSEGRALSQAPPHRTSSKRPVSTTSENWLAQSSGKKPVTHHHAHSHRPKSASGHRLWTTLQSKPNLHEMAPTPPPANPPKHIGDHLIHAKQSWPMDKEKILLSPYVYLYQRPGKDVRTQIISAFNAWLKVPEDRLNIITKVVGMLHTSSLLVDDVEDSSLLRRGAPVAHNIFGIPQVINSANYVYFLALQELMTLNNPKCIEIFTEELLNLHRGQGMDLFWRDNLTCPTEDDYLEMVSNKTGGLFRLAIKLMEAESTLIHPTSDSANTTAGATIRPVSEYTQASPQRDISCVPLINTIGMLFQVLDDLLNLCSTTYHARKGHAEDLTEGKFSFPIIHAIRADPSDMVLLNILRQKTTDAEVKQFAVEYMEKIGSFEYTRRVITELEKKAVKEVARLEEKVGGREGKDGGEKIRVILGKLKAL